ncbi:adenylate/guanylate cyclase domain-containing protein [Bacteroidota bacterium]
MLKGKRLLAAIMFTDIVGYTALMQEDEQNAKRIRDRHKSVLEDKIKEHHGTILQYYGDGTLSIFSSGIEAVLCAIEIQKKLLEEPKIPLRIGIHIGDIVQEDEGIYGDGVNIASRIESISVPGAILISDKLHDELLNQPEIKTQNLGKFDLKNVKRPVDIFAVTSGDVVVPTADKLKYDKAKSTKSIAVLPFINMSTDPENEYFSDGITEEILNALVKVDGLMVTSRTSSFVFKGKNLDAREIGKQLDVNTILEGSVRKSGNRVRITSQLINSSDGYHIWSETYDRNLEDIFAVQDEIAGKIVNTLREKLSGKEKQTHLVTAKTENIEAYNLFLKGKFNLNKWTPESGKLGIKYFEKAIEMESGFAAAYAGLAFAYTIIGAIGFIHPHIAYKKAKENALKAIKLDDNLPSAHVALGLVYVFVEWNLNASYNYFQKALKLSPGDGTIYHAYSVYLTAKRKTKEAIEVLQNATELDPLSTPIRQALGEALMNHGRYDEALEQLNNALEIEPEFRSAIETKGWCYLQKSDYKKAIKTFKEYQGKTGDSLKGQTGLGFAYAISGDLEKAHECLNKIKEREKRDKDVDLEMDYVIVYAGIKDYDKVFYHMAKSLESGNVAFFLRTHFFAKDIRKDPRFDELISKAGLE